MKVNKTVCDIKDCKAERDNSLVQSADWLEVDVSNVHGSAGSPRGSRRFDLCPAHALALSDFLVTDQPVPAESPVDAD